MRRAASLDLELGMLRPGIKVTTSPTDFQPIKQLYLVRFDGADWVVGRCADRRLNFGLVWPIIRAWPST